MRKLFFIILVVFTAMVLSPWISGLWLHHEYNKFIAFLNTGKQVEVKITSYKTHWFSSDAILSVKIINPDFFKSLMKLGVPNTLTKEPFDFTLLQKIQHGPVIFNTFSTTPSHFGLALIQNKLQLSAGAEKILNWFGIAKNHLELADDFVTFNGSYYKNITLSNLKYISPGSDERVNLNKLQIRFWVNPQSHRITADTAINKILYTDGSNIFSMSDVQIKLDQYRSKQGLWLGTSDMRISGIYFNEIDAPPASMSNIKFSGNIEQNAGEISLKRELVIGKINVEDFIFGPIHLQIDAQKLNLQAVLDMLAVYREVSQRGELYQSELRQRMLNKLPNLINPGSFIKLEKFDFVTDEGSLKMDGKIIWPKKNFLQPTNLSEVMDDSKIHAIIRVSKKLTNQIIQFVTETPYFRRVPAEVIRKISTQQRDVMLIMQQNAFFLASLVDQGYLPDEVGAELLNTMKNDPLSSEYFDKVKTLFLTKAISQDTSHMLYWQADAVKKEVKFLIDQSDKFKSTLSQQLNSQIETWLKKGLITQNEQEYIFSLTREQGIIKLNGKPI